MNLPQLPTDNLYKFMAILGLFLYGVSLVVPTVVYDHEWERAKALRESRYAIILKLKGELTSVRADLDRLHSANEEAKENLEREEALAQKGQSDPETQSHQKMEN